MRGSEIHLKNAMEMLLVEYQKGYRKVMRALAHLRSEVKDFFDFAINPILLVRKQKGLEKVPTSCNSICQLLSYVLRGR
jgi:hypothetical protein